jgi:competence protein ComEC
MRAKPTSFGHSLERAAAPASHGPVARAPLFHAAWLFALGIVIAHWVWLRPSVVLIGLVAVLVVTLLAAWRAQRVVWIPLAALWCLLGYWCAQMQPHPAPAPGLAILSDGLIRTVEGTVIDIGPLRSTGEEDLDEPATEQRPTQRIDVRAATLETVSNFEDAQQSASGNVRLTVRWPVSSRPAGFHCGDVIRAQARLLQPETYRDPGVWSREDFLIQQGITSSATVNADQINQTGGSPSSMLACQLSALQHRSTARLLALPAAMHKFPGLIRLSQEDAVMLSAMIDGDRSFLTHSLRVGFERTGSFHMLVVSGFHLAIVAGCIFWIARRLRIPQFPATLITIVASFTYAVFTGFATPVQRSLWMITLYLLARLLFRERSVLNTIGFACLCLLTLSPSSLFDASLQMTLLAVISIGGIAAPLLANTIHPYLTATRDLRLTAIDVKLSPALGRFRETLRLFCGAFAGTYLEKTGWRVFPFAARFILRIAEMIVVACVVELAMTLPMALYFHRITLFALPVNLVALPLLVLMMPAALTTLAVVQVWPAGGVIPAIFVALPLHLGVALVRFFGSFAVADIRIPAPLLLQSAAFCLLMALALVLVRGGRRQRRASWAALVLAAIVAVFPRPIQHPHNAMLAEAIDVGQGDSILLITPDGKTLLVDGGGFGGGPHQAPQDFDIGEEVVSQTLWSRGIRHLDAVALTHAHSDHMGGLPAVLRNFHPNELWVGNNPPVGAYNALMREAADLGVRVRSFRAGDAVPLGLSQVAVLAPFRDYQPGNEPKNNDSLVLHVAYGATSVMLEGDAEAPVESAMLSEPGLASTLLKVGHHGSITSTQPQFLARVSPQFAVISCGLHNRYGHPRKEVLEELQSLHIRTLSTDINGAACFLLDGKNATADASCGHPQ